METPGAIMWDINLKKQWKNGKLQKVKTQTKIPSFEGIIADMDHNRYHHIENQY